MAPKPRFGIPDPKPAVKPPKGRRDPATFMLGQDNPDLTIEVIQGGRAVAHPPVKPAATTA